MKSSLVSCLVALFFVFTGTAAMADDQFSQEMGKWIGWVKADAKLTCLTGVLGKPDAIHGNFYQWFHALDKGTKEPKSLFAYVMDYNGTPIVLALSDGTNEGLTIFPWANGVLQNVQITP